MFALMAGAASAGESHFSLRVAELSHLHLLAARRDVPLHGRQWEPALRRADGVNGQGLREMASQILEKLDEAFGAGREGVLRTRVELVGRHAFGEAPGFRPNEPVHEQVWLAG